MPDAAVIHCTSPGPITPPALYRFEIGPIVSRYMAWSSLVEVELDSTSRRIDVVGERIDVALRVRFPPIEDADLAKRVSGESAQRIVCSASVIETLPRPVSPSRLADLPSMDLDQPQREHVRELEGPQQAYVRIRHQPRLITDDTSQLGTIEDSGIIVR